MMFASAYTQLNQAERRFVDGFIASIGRENERQPLERFVVTLERFAATFDVSTLDARSRDMLVKPLVQAAIREQCEGRSNAGDILVERVLREIAKIAFATPKNFHVVQPDGTTAIDMSKATDDDWAAIKSVECEEEYSRARSFKKQKVQMHGKTEALMKLYDFCKQSGAVDRLFERYNNPADNNRSSVVYRGENVSNKYQQRLESQS